jgi:prophage regulatory protein
MVKQSQAVQTALVILRRKQVEARTGLSRSTLYAYIAAGNFPPPYALGARAVGWRESDVEAWLVSRVQLSRTAA